MGSFLDAIGFFGFMVFIIMAIVSKIRKTGKGKKRMIYAAGFFVLMIIGGAMTPAAKETVATQANVEKKNVDSSKQKAADEAKKKADEVAKKKAEAAAKKKAADKAAAKKKADETPKVKLFKSIKALIDSKQAFDTGSYIKGDIPAGEYAFVSFEGSGKYYSENDAANNIIDNENFDSFGYVYVHAAGNLETQGVLIKTSALPKLGVKGAKQVFEILNDMKDYKGAGFYKVGVDLPAGRYIINSQGEGYVAALTGPVGKNDIIQNENFNGRYSVTVSNGQYLTISRGTISQ